jgi:hypothetical protein
MAHLTDFWLTDFMENNMRTIRLLLAASALILIGCNEVKFEAGRVATTSCTTPECQSGQDVGDGTQTLVLKNDTFNVPSNRAIDILFVIDNSGSMGPEQMAISTRLASFTNVIETSGLDWRIAITSTDVSGNYAGARGTLVSFNTAGLKVITKDTPNYAALFQAAVRLGENGSGNERGLEATYLSVGLNADNWIRPGAHFATVVVSDENENSDGSGQANAVARMLAQVETKLGPNKNFTFNSIIIKPDDMACFNTQDMQGNFRAYFGSYYANASTSTSGVIGSVCSTDYGNELRSIGDNVVSLVDTIQLSCEPYMGIVTVKDGAGAPLAFTLDKNRVKLNIAALPGSVVKLTYNCLK